MQKTRTYVAYALFGMPLAFFALPLYVHLPRLYTEQIGLPLAGVGLVLLAARLLDAVLDPWLGRWSDQGPARKHLLLLSTPLLLLGWAILFLPPKTATLAWLATGLVIAYFGYSLAMINYQAWGTEFPSHQRGRLQASAWREGAGLCGVLLAAVLPNVLSSDLRHGVAYLSWVFIPLLFFATLLAICWVPQGRHQHASSKHSNLPAQQAIWQVWRAPAFVRLVGVYAINGIAAAIPATLVLFFINDVLHAESWSGVFLMLYFAAAAVALPLWVRLADSYGRVSTWLLAMALACASFAAVPWLGPGDVFAFATICIASGVALGADLVLPPALLAEHVAEHGNAGGNFGWWTAVTKLNLAVAAGISLPLLSVLGYAPGTSGDGVRALAWLYGGLPLLLKLFAGVLLWRSRLYLQKLTQGVHA